MGSWLEGTPQRDNDDTTTAAQRLGIPEEGPGSAGGMLRRIAALCVDWGVAMGISWLLFDYHQLATLGVFALEQFLLVSSLGYSIGHWIFGLKVRPEETNRQYVGFIRGAVRALLVCLVLPAVIWDRDGRGMHDRAARTILVRR